MSDDNDQPVFTGTPDQWWEQAEQITEAEAADRHLGSWYISAVMAGGVITDTYRLSRPTHGSNEQRKNALRRDTAMGLKTPEHVSPNVRVLIRQSIEMPEWVSAELVIAAREEGSDERTAWRRNANGRWTQVFAGKTISEQTMRLLAPAPAIITEG